MILFQCPKCQANLKAPTDKVGARSKCNRCQTPVVVPDLDRRPAPPLDAAEEVSQGIPAEPEEIEEPARPSPLMRALLLIDMVLDVRFKRYLTPYIIQAAWILLIVCSVAGFVLSRFAMPVIEALEQKAMRASKQRRFDNPNAFDQRSFESHRPTKLDALVDWAFGTIGYVIGSVVLLLAARVAGESLIVVFNISADLKAVRRKQLTSGS
jgi:hypothetical protein